MTASLIFPNQLFENNPCLDKTRRIFLVEDDLFFTRQPFHKQKLVLHRASMKYYADYLTNLGHRVSYIDQKDYQNLGHFFKKTLGDEVQEIHFCDPIDYLLSRRLKRYSEKLNIRLHQYDSPNFFNTKAINEDLFGNKKNYLMADFYKKQRIRLGILTENDKPVGGKWSFDTDNRKALPKSVHVPIPKFPKENQYVTKAIEYVEENFDQHPGQTRPFVYAITFHDAKDVLLDFIQTRVEGYGPYQDALTNDHPFVFHSLISAPLNIGLLDPRDVIAEVLKAHENNKEVYSSLEGFIRQVIGWREFIRAIYERDGVKQRTTNYWGFQNEINGSLFATLDPLKKVHQKLEKYAYAHHIERLMVLGNFFLLAEVHPDKVYDYFMTYFIDAYDWVMVPNVYGMSQYADGGIMTTKPYISSSNYLKNQGLTRDPAWAETWDSLYWNFLNTNRPFFEANFRTKQMTWHLDKMGPEKLKIHLDRAQAFLEQLNSIPASSN
jgi:deoxyribodipyrimidine photolyase-related protein